MRPKTKQNSCAKFQFIAPFTNALVGADDHIGPRKCTGFERADVVIGPYWLCDKL